MEQVRGLTQAYLNTPWRKQLQIIMLCALVVVFWALIAGIYVDLRQRTAIAGREILWLQSQIESQEQMIADRETELAVITSAKVMEDRAWKLGFRAVQNDEILYLFVPGYTPRGQAVLAPPRQPARLEPAAPPADYTESLFSWTRRHIQPLLQQLQEVQQ